MPTLLTYTVLQKGRITTTVKGAQSHTYANEDVYDGSNYRNELDASYIGRAWNQTTAVTGGTTAESSLMAGSPPWVGDETQDAEAMDDRLNEVDPRNELKKRTKLIIWSEAAGTGNILFEGWADRIESFSIGTYQTL